VFPSPYPTHPIRWFVPRNLELVLTPLAAAAAGSDAA